MILAQRFIQLTRRRLIRILGDDDLMIEDFLIQIAVSTFFIQTASSLFFCNEHFSIFFFGFICALLSLLNVFLGGGFLVGVFVGDLRYVTIPTGRTPTAFFTKLTARR